MTDDQRLAALGLVRAALVRIRDRHNAFFDHGTDRATLHDAEAALTILDAEETTAQSPLAQLRTAISYSPNPLPMMQTLTLAILDGYDSQSAARRTLREHAGERTTRPSDQPEGA